VGEKIVVEIQYSIDDYVRGLEFIKNKSFSYRNNYLFIGASGFITFIIFYFLTNKNGNGLNLTDALMLILGLMLIIPRSHLKNSLIKFTDGTT